MKMSIEQRREKRRKYNKEWRRKNPDKVRINAKKTYENNKEARLKYIAQWQKDNPDKRKLSMDKYLKKHGDRVKERKNERKKTPAFFYEVLKANSKKRGDRCPVTIGKKEFIDWYNDHEKKCTYCELRIEDMPESFKSPAKRQKNNRLTIDRMDNKKGYSPENITLACPRCNTVKTDFFTFDEMKKIGIEIMKPKWEREINNV